MNLTLSKMLNNQKELDKAIYDNYKSKVDNPICEGEVELSILTGLFVELGEFINENFEKLSKLLIDKIVVKKSADKTRVILNIYINLFNITYIWDYNNFEKISSLCSHNEDNDSNSSY